MRFFKLSVLILFFVLLSIPALHNMILPLPSFNLGGKESSSKFPRFDAASLWEGNFQRKFERWFTRQTGLWPLLVRSENQLNFSVFKLASTNYRSTVVLGKSGNLIERAYLKSASKLQDVPDSRLETKAKRIAKLQRKLSQKGIALLLLISASKPEIYPDMIPAGYKVDPLPNWTNSYDVMRPLLSSYNVNVLDGAELLRAEKSRSDYPLFASSGTHWNEYAACIVSREITQWMRTKLWPNIASLSCEPVSLRRIPSFADRDLSRTLNVWYPEETYKPQPKPNTSRVTPENERDPRVLFIGTSFMWSLFRHFDRQKILVDRSFLYYFKTRYDYPGRNKSTIDYQKLDWEGDLLKHDAIVIEVNQAFLHKAGHGFVKHALNYFEKDTSGTAISRASDGDLIARK